MPKKPFLVVAAVLMATGCLLLGAGVLYRFLLPKAYHATTTIRVEKDPSEMIRPGQEGAGSAPFDPFFIQTEFEKIQSKLILYPVISNLNLNHTWGKKVKDAALKTEVTYRLLKERIEISQSRGSALFEISAWSDDPAEAAALANEIARVYRESAGASRREQQTRGKEKTESVKPPVEIIDVAETPPRPARPNHAIGVAMLVLGGVSLLTGFLLLLMTTRLERPPEM